jgi:hypothetical protein
VSEGSGGNGTQNSPGDCPVTQLRSIANGRVQFLSSTHWQSNSYVSLPVNNFPIGHALATVFVNGIPSVSRIVLISPALPPVVLVNPLRLPNGSFQFSFTNTPGTIFTVLAANDISLPLSDWTVLGSPAEVFAGQFQFTDSQAPNNSPWFYRVRSP